MQIKVTENKQAVELKEEFIVSTSIYTKIKEEKQRRKKKERK